MATRGTRAISLSQSTHDWSLAYLDCLGPIGAGVETTALVERVVLHPGSVDQDVVTVVIRNHVLPRRMHVQEVPENGDVLVLHSRER